MPISYPYYTNAAGNYHMACHVVFGDKESRLFIRPFSGDQENENITNSFEFYDDGKFNLLFYPKENVKEPILHLFYDFDAPPGDGDNIFRETQFPRLNNICPPIEITFLDEEEYHKFPDEIKSILPYKKVHVPD